MRNEAPTCTHGVCTNWTTQNMFDDWPRNVFFRFQQLCTLFFLIFTLAMTFPRDLEKGWNVVFINLSHSGNLIILMFCTHRSYTCFSKNCIHLYIQEMLICYCVGFGCRCDIGSASNINGGMGACSNHLFHLLIATLFIFCLFSSRSFLRKFSSINLVLHISASFLPKSPEIL